MKIEEHVVNGLPVAEVISDKPLIMESENALDLLGNLYYQGFSHIILHEKNITPAFFNLRSGMAGEILQKFSNFRVGLAIVGDFSKYPEPALGDFMRESNAKGHIRFVSSVAEAIAGLSK